MIRKHYAYRNRLALKRPLKLVQDFLLTIEH